MKRFNAIGEVSYASEVRDVLIPYVWSVIRRSEVRDVNY